MSALDFPTPTEVGQVYIANGKTWVWDGVSWNNQTAGFSGSKGFTGSIGFTGSRGAGFTGSQGETGFAGSIGGIGFTGSIGIGFTGSRGDTGFVGSQGIIGFSGSQGTIGFTGSQGIQGLQGNIGYTGSQGTQGIQGVQGNIGYTGSQGIQGTIGFTGSQGIQGLQGTVGFTGSQGIQGIQGTIGYTGSQGIQGLQGTTGFTGSQGIQGVQGLVGEGVATGGVQYDLLQKSSSTDYDTEWTSTPTVDSLIFDTTTGSEVSQLGELLWDADAGTIDVLMNHGVVQNIGEDQYYLVQAAENISKGDVCIAVGTIGESGVILVARSVPVYQTQEIISQQIMGLASSDILQGERGYVQAFGQLRKIDTTAFQQGEILWVDPTVAGGLTNTQPEAPNWKTIVALVVARHEEVGALQVRPTFGSSLANDELVHLPSLVDDGILRYNDANGRFELESLGTMADQNSDSVSITGGTVDATLTYDNTVSTLTSTDVKAAIDELDGKVGGLLSASDAMIFKGTLGTGATYTTLPTTYETGWTLKVTQAGTYAGQVAEVGDLYIALVDRSGSGNLDSDWTVVQTNIDGAVTGPASSTNDNVALFDGTTGKVIKDSGVSVSAINGLGTMSTQDSDSVSVTGGSIDGTAIGATTASTGAFTDLSSTNDAVINGITVGQGGNPDDFNTAFGFETLTSTTTGVSNVAFGYQAMKVGEGTANAGIGVFALTDNTGSGNTAVGTGSLSANTSGGLNVAVGYRSLSSNTTGSNNVGVGYDAGRLITTGSGNTILGHGLTGSAGLEDTVIIGAGGQPRIYIDSNGNTGLGTTSPNAALTIQTSESTTSDLLSLNIIGEHSDTSGGSNLFDYNYYGGGVNSSVFIRTKKARGSVASPTIVANNEITARIGGMGYDGAKFVDNALIRFRVDGTPSLNNMPGAIEFWTTTSTALSQKMVIDSSGRVGIGTTSPARKLTVFGGSSEVSGTINTNSLLLLENNTDAFIETKTPSEGYTGIRFTDNTTSAGGIGYAHNLTTENNELALAAWVNITFRTSATDGIFEKTERMRIDGSGNVGIGTTSPSAKLDIIGTTSKSSTHYAVQNGVAENIILQQSRGSFTSKSFSGANDGTAIAGETYNLGVFEKQSGISFENDGSTAGNGRMRLFTRKAGTYSESMRIDSNGRVGIGTTSPSEKLDVNGTLIADRIQLRDGSSTIGGSSSNAGNAVLQIGDTTGAFIIFDTNEIQQFGTTMNLRGENGFSFDIGDAADSTGETVGTISSAGNFGIGITSPAQRLDISGTGQASSDFRAPIFYDSNDTGFYVNPASTSNLNALTIQSLRSIGEIDIGSGSSNTGRIKSLTNNSGSPGFELSDNYSDLVWAIGADDRGGDTQGNNAFVIRYNSGGTSFGSEWTTAGSEYFTIDALGNVGIGTTSPSSKLQVAGTITPSVNATHDLGSSSLRWNTVYTSDLSLKNDHGDWTIVEGEDDLFLYNNKKNKVYKFALTEVEPDTAPPKRD